MTGYLLIAVPNPNSDHRKLLIIDLDTQIQGQ